MTFLSPWFLLGAAAAAVPIVLHLLKREPEPRVRFAPVKLLKDAPVEHTEKRRLRELLLLALRVTTLVLLAVTFARPFIGAGAAVGPSSATVVLLDTSYSMSAPGRFERARALARAAVDRNPGLVGVVTFAEQATVAARLSADRTFARSAIDAAVPGFGSTRYRAAIGAAVRLLEDRRGTVLVVTDLQEGGWDGGDRVSVPESARLEVIDVGPLPPNLAVTAVRAEKDKVIASVRNDGDETREARVRLALDRRPAGEATVAVGPHGLSNVEWGSLGATTAAVEVEDAQGLQADNIKYAIIDRMRRRVISIVTATGDLAREAFYVQQALTAAGDGEDYRIAPTSASKLSTWDEVPAPDLAAVLLLSTRGLERRGREALAAYTAAGGAILIAAGPDIDGEVAAGVLGRDTRIEIVTAGEAQAQQRSWAPSDVRHPIFRAFAGGASTLGLITFQRIARLQSRQCQTIARFTTGEPALVECASGSGRGLVFASDLDGRWNDFPLRATFVPFLHEAVRYLSAGLRSSAEYVVGHAPPAVPDRPGLATIPADGTRGARTIAVNVDIRESDPARLEVDDFMAAVARLRDQGAAQNRVERQEQEDRQHLWQYALALVILALAFEGLVAARTA